jgi:Zn finger protein HypA/HybF involved in hydrogenase expression
MELNICLRCNHISSDFYEDETKHLESQDRILCPKCKSSYYFIATEKELKQLNS